MGHHTDDIRLGPVYLPNPDYLADGNPSPMELGVGPVGRVYIWDVLPVASGAALLAALQTTAGAAPLVLTPGAGVTTSYNPLTMVTSYVLDVARRVTLTSAGNLSGINFTVRGLDQYKQPISQVLAGPNANTVSTLKAFKQILSVTPNAAVGSNVSVGFNDSFGFPIRIDDAGYLGRIGWANTLAQDAGALVAADTTNPATGATGDVRGIYTPSNAANGTRRLVIELLLKGSQAGPQATLLAAAGVPQA